MGDTTLKDAEIGSVISTGIGSPHAPPGRPIGLQVTKWNADRQEFEEAHVFATVDEACLIAEDLAEMISAARALA